MRVLVEVQCVRVELRDRQGVPELCRRQLAGDHRKHVHGKGEAQMHQAVKDLARRMGIGRKKRKGLERAINNTIRQLRHQARAYRIRESMVLSIWAKGMTVGQVFDLARKQGAIAK